MFYKNNKTCHLLQYQIFKNLLKLADLVNLPLCVFFISKVDIIIRKFILNDLFSSISLNSIKEKQKKDLNDNDNISLNNIMNYIADKLIANIAFPAPKPSKYTKNLFKCLKEVTDKKIPILYYQQWEKNNQCPYWMIFFHGNAEDLHDAAQFATRMMVGLYINAIVVEYPGYGIYNNSESKPREDIIEEDAHSIYNYMVDNLKVDPQKIYIVGRSIGTGPAFYLANKFSCAGLIVISPYRSINQSQGTWLDYWGSKGKPVFDNLKRCEGVQAKCVIIHGEKDKVIPIQNSVDIYNKMKSSNRNASVVLKIIAGKDHNDLDVETEIVKNCIESFNELKIRRNN